MEPQLLIVMILALGAGAVVKGATGMGLPLVAMPILAAFLGVPHAIAVMMLPIIVTNAWQLLQYRGHLGGMHFLTGFLLAAVLGVVIGTWLLTALPESTLALALASSSCSTSQFISRGRMYGCRNEPRISWRSPWGSPQERSRAQPASVRPSA